MNSTLEVGKMGAVVLLEKKWESKKEGKSLGIFFVSVRSGGNLVLQ